MAGTKRKQSAPPKATKNRKTATAITPSTSRVTRDMTRIAAVHAVLGTTELLEGILISVPMFDLFVIQRISQSFRDCIAKSHKLQERMYSRSTGIPAESWVAHPGRYNEDWTVIPGDFAPRSPKNEATYDAEHIMDSSYMPAKLCPMFEGGNSSFLCAGSPYIENIILRSLSRKLTTRLDFTAPGSWRGMQVTNPPITRVEVNVPYNYWPGSKRTTPTLRLCTIQDVHRDSGITLGALFDGAHKHHGELDRYQEDDEDSTVRGWRKYANHQDSIALKELRVQGSDYSGKFEIDTASIRIAAGDTVVASDEEWQAVHDRAAQTNGADANTASPEA
ncbi:hypothetical protein LTR95_001082 [Oleoguttula sp. CCFEE 5521]